MDTEETTALVHTRLSVGPDSEAEDPWHVLAANILLQAVHDAEYQREESSRYARYRARQWLLESSWAARLCDEIEIAHERIKVWISNLPPLEPDEWPPSEQ